MKPSKSVAILILRIASGLMMLSHGILKLGKFNTFPNVQFGDPIGIGPELSLILIVFAEFICAILIVLGYKTKFAAIPLMIGMIVIVFVVHGNDPFSRQELPLLYLSVYTALLFLGSGKYSLDYLLKK